MRKLLLIAAVALLSGLPGRADSVNDLKAREAKVKAVVDKVMRSVVCLQPGKNGQGSGSGVIVSKDGLIMTAAHVTQATGEELRIVFPDGRVVKGISLGANRMSDGGLAKITEPASEEWPFAEMGSSDTLKLGDWCVAMGHPGGYDNNRPPPVRLGRVWRRDPEGHIFTNCPLIGGDSGGPLFDLEGRVIGINSSIHGSTDMNRHVDVDSIKFDWDRMLKDQTWGRPLSFSLDRRRPIIGAKFDQESQGGVKVTEVPEDRPAAKIGIKAGDIIVRFDGQETKTSFALTRQLGGRKPGDKVKIAWLRDGKETEAEIELTSRNTGTASADNKSEEGGPDLSRLPGPKVEEPKKGPQPWLGAACEDGGGKGARVAEVQPDSPAAKAGLVAGDLISGVNDREIRDAATLAEALSEMKPGDKLSIRSRRGELDQTMDAELGTRP